MGKLKIFILLSLLNISAYSMTITDILGRTVTINKPVNKIIALGTSLSYVTYLNSVDKVIGIEEIELKDVKKRAYTYVNRNKIKNLPIIGRGGKGKLTNIEALIILNPDVIFTITTDKNEADTLSKQLNKPVIVVSYGIKTVNLQYIYDSLKIMGKVLNKNQRANELISYIKSLKKEFITPMKKEDAYIGAIAYKGLQGITSTRTNFLPFLLSSTNNIASQLDIKGQFFIDKEFLLIKNPKHIFIDVAGVDLLKNDFSKNKNFYERLDAFKSNTYLLLANTYYFINIDNMFANSFFIAKTLYPEQYADLDPVKKANEIFNFFVNEPLYRMNKNDSGGFQKISIDNNKLVFKSI